VCKQSQTVALHTNAHHTTALNTHPTQGLFIIEDAHNFDLPSRSALSLTWCSTTYFVTASAIVHI